MNYWETPSYLALILTMCKRNVSPKEIISHSRKPEKSLILTKLQSYNYKQCWTKQTYRSTHYTDPEGMLRLSREVKETMKPTINRHNKLCNCCGSEPHTSDKKCPASGAECHYCHKCSHFSKVCQERNLSQIVIISYDTYQQYPQITSWTTKQLQAMDNSTNAQACKWQQQHQ